MNEWLLTLFERYHKAIGAIVKGALIFLMLLYVAYFVKLGLYLVAASGSSVPETIFHGLLLAALIVVLFFIEHFSGGIDFNIRLVGLFIGLALGGASIGLIAGYIQTLIGWIVGCFIGIAVISFSITAYFKKNEKMRDTSLI